MVDVPVCDEKTIETLMRAIRKAALGRPIAIAFEAGVHRSVKDGWMVSVPNGCLTIRIAVAGGARDTGHPGPSWLTRLWMRLQLWWSR